MPRKSKMENHPDFQKIIEEVINKRMTGRKASKLLGSTEPNFSQYMNRHYPKHKPKKKKTRRSKKGSVITGDKEGDAILTIELGSSQTNEEWGTVAWRMMIQNLITTLTTDPDLELNQIIRLSTVLTNLLKFQFSHSVPDISKETIAIDKELEKEIIDQVLKDHDKWCPYRSKFIATKDKGQSKARLESTEPSLVE